MNKCTLAGTKIFFRPLHPFKPGFLTGSDLSKIKSSICQQLGEKGAIIHSSRIRVSQEVSLQRAARWETHPMQPTLRSYIHRWRLTETNRQRHRERHTDTHTMDQHPLQVTLTHYTDIWTDTARNRYRDRQTNTDMHTLIQWTNSQIDSA